MRNIFVIVTAIFLIFPGMFWSQSTPKWAVELDEEIKNYEFFNQGKHLFFTNGKYVWCYDSPSGSEVWSMEVDEF